MLARLQVTENTLEIADDASSAAVYFHGLPRELWLMIGRMAGLPTLSAMMQSCRFFRSSFSPTPANLARNLPVVTLAERVGYQIRSGGEEEVKELLVRAKALGKLDEIFTKPTQVPLTRTKAFQSAPLIYTVLWSLDRYMLDVLKKHIDPQVLIQQIKEYNAADCHFTIEHGKHFDFSRIIQCWKNYSDYIDSLITKGTLNQIAPDSNEDEELQRLFQLIVTESATLPMHVINQFTNSTRSLVMNEKIVEFNETELDRAVSIVNSKDYSESYCDSLHSKGDQFGVTYGVIRTESTPVRANVKDALQYAKLAACVIGIDGVAKNISLARVHTDALIKLSIKLHDWQTAVINDAMNSPVSSPKVAKA